MVTIKERLASIEVKVKFIILVLLGKTGLEFIPIVTACFR